MCTSQLWQRWAAINITFFILASILLIIPSPVHSFGTVDILEKFLHQNDEHEHITRAALGCHGKKCNGDCFEPISLDQVAGKDHTFGAVGTPDNKFPNGAEGPEAHCDNADFLNNGEYFRDRRESNIPLFACAQHAQKRFMEGIQGAKTILNSEGQIVKNFIEIPTVECVWGVPGRGKCNAIEGFGRALHTVQDFYAHSNWVDINVGPYDVLNPPGLSLSATSDIMNLRRYWNESTPEVPPDFTTGCYNGDFSDEFEGVGDCVGRITHKTMNKDHGDIDSENGHVSRIGVETPRGVLNDNFIRAVNGSITETIHQWAEFRAELRRTYGERHANLMICAMTRDKPMVSCHGRRLAIVVDSSGSNTYTDPSNIRIDAAQKFNSLLITQAMVGPDELPDRVTVIDFDDVARVIYPLGDPANASFTGIDSSGGTSIASGLKLAIDELIKDDGQDPTDRAGIILLTDGEDSDTSSSQAQLQRAASLGIRVNWGRLAPPTTPLPPQKLKRSADLVRRDPPISLISDILNTGGFYGTIDSASAQQTFIDLVVSYGATNLDDAYGDNGGGPLFPGVTVTALASASSGPDTFTYHATAGQQLEFVVQSLAGQILNLTLYDVRRVRNINSTATDSAGKSAVSFVAMQDVDLEFIIDTEDPAEGVYSVALNATQIPGFVASPHPSSNSTCPTRKHRHHRGGLHRSKGF